VVLNYKIEKTVDTEQRNKMVEAKITIMPHPKYTSEVMQGNKRQATVAEFPIDADIIKSFTCKSKLPF
jgi:hypothetical protein